MAKVKKMAFGGMGGRMFAPKPAMKPAPKQAPLPTNGAQTPAMGGGFGAVASNALGGASNMAKLLGANTQQPAAGGITGTGNTQQDAYNDYMKQMNASGNKPYGGTAPMPSNMTQTDMQKMAQQQSAASNSLSNSLKNIRPMGGGLANNKPPANANLTQAYQSIGMNAPSLPKMSGPLGATPTAGSQAAAPVFKGLGGIGAGMKKGGAVKSKSYAKGGTVSSASKRGDGIAQRGKTKGRMV